MIKEIKIDKNACIGCGTCTVVAPNAFKINSQGVSQTKEDALKTSEDILLKTAQSCPVKAISLIDGNQTKIYPKE
jgi:ferredoxin